MSVNINHPNNDIQTTLGDAPTLGGNAVDTAAGTSYDNATSGLAATNAQDAFDELILTTSETYTVGATGDFPTLNAALRYLSMLTPVYLQSGIAVNLQLQAGYIMEEQVLVRGLNLGWITITGVDAETIIDHTTLTTNFTLADYGFSSFPAFGVSKGGVLPRIGQLFRFSVAGVGGNKHGVMSVGAGSSAEIFGSYGVVDAGTYGIYAARNSSINAEGANASGAGTYGIYVTTESSINALNANASGAGDVGIYATGSSSINARNAIIQNQTTGIACVRVLAGSFIEASSIDTTGSTVPALSQTANTLTGSGIIFQ